MSKFVTSCRSKTFLLGEYSVLRSKKALLLLTEPSFYAEFDPKYTAQNIPYHCQKFVEKRAPFLKDISYNFSDPYKGKGGMGASSAEFLFYLRAGAYYAEKKYDINLRDYRNLCRKYYIESTWCGEGIEPSGIDLVSQDYSGIVFVDKDMAQVNSMPWPFKDVNISLVHTGNKLPTHTHLESLTSLPSLSMLDNMVSSAWEAFEVKDIMLLAAAINNAANFLQNLGLVAQYTSKIIASAHRSNIFYAAKGCGAMGSDVILFLYNSFAEEKAYRFFRANNLHVLATEKNI